MMGFTDGQPWSVYLSFPATVRVMYLFKFTDLLSSDDYESDLCSTCYIFSHSLESGVDITINVGTQQ